MTSDRILLAVDGLPIGGLEGQVVELIRGLRRRGRFQVVLARLDHGGELEREALHASAGALRIRRRARFDWTPGLSLTWQARRAGIRLIQAQGWMSALAALPTARWLGIPLVNATVQDAPPRLRWRHRVARWCARRSDWIVANSHAGLEAYDLRGHSRAQVIANGIELARFDGVLADPPRDPTICMVANFSRFKDHATVIHAMRIVRASIANAVLLLIGHDRGTLADSRRLADRLGLDGAVQFITDSVRPESFVARSHVGVLASGSEGLPNAVLEYMALSKPVVATATCGDAVRLIRGGSGLLVPPRSPEEFARRIVELLDDPERARQMGQTGRQQVQQFDVDRMVAEHEALYERLLRARRSTPQPSSAAHHR